MAGPHHLLELPQRLALLTEELASIQSRVACLEVLLKERLNGDSGRYTRLLETCLGMLLVGRSPCSGQPLPSLQQLCATSWLKSFCGEDIGSSKSKDHRKIKISEMSAPPRNTYDTTTIFLLKSLCSKVERIENNLEKSAEFWNNNLKEISKIMSEEIIQKMGSYMWRYEDSLVRRMKIENKKFTAEVMKKCRNEFEVLLGQHSIQNIAKIKQENMNQDRYKKDLEEAKCQIDSLLQELHYKEERAYSIERELRLQLSSIRAQLTLKQEHVECLTHELEHLHRFLESRQREILRLRGEAAAHIRYIDHYWKSCFLREDQKRELQFEKTPCPTLQFDDNHYTVTSRFETSICSDYPVQPRHLNLSPGQGQRRSQEEDMKEKEECRRLKERGFLWSNTIWNRWARESSPALRLADDSHHNNLSIRESDI